MLRTYVFMLQHFASLLCIHFISVIVFAFAFAFAALPLSLHPRCGCIIQLSARSACVGRRVRSPASLRVHRVRTQAKACCNEPLAAGADLLAPGSQGAAVQWAQLASATLPSSSASSYPPVLLGIGGLCRQPELHFEATTLLCCP